MNLVQRVQDILLKPKETWPVIAGEAAEVTSIYKDYLVYLAAIPAVAAFIGLSLVGVGGFGVSFRVPFVSGLVNMVVSYALSLAMVYVLSLVVDRLAPTFNGRRDPLAALKLVAYGSTAGFVGGIFSLLPSLGALGLLAALYSVYLIYLGLPVLMRCPQDKAVAYTAVVIVCGVVAGIVLTAVTALVTPSRSGMMAGMHGADSGEVSIKTPGGEININTAKMDEMAKKMEEAGKRMEAAQKSGDGAATGKALSDMMGAMGAMGGVVGGATGGGTPIPAQDLKALLPETLNGLKRESYEAQGGQAMGLAGSSAKATYGSGEQRVELAITDMGGLAGLAAMAGWANMTVDRETNTEVEKVYKQGGRTVREEFRKDGSHGEVTVILANGVLVAATGSKMELPALKQAVEVVDLGKLEAMKRAAKP